MCVTSVEHDVVRLSKVCSPPDALTVKIPIPSIFLLIGIISFFIAMGSACFLLYPTSIAEATIIISVVFLALMLVIILMLAGWVKYHIEVSITTKSKKYK